MGRLIICKTDRCIIIEMLKDKYWKHQEKINERSE